MSLTTANPPATAKLLPFHTVAGVDYPVSKVAFGDADTVTPVDSDNPMPVTGEVTVAGVATAAAQDAAAALLGAVTEAAPASDTASSGLNGRLQRIAQRVTSLIALLPASLGAKLSSASLSVTLASDQPALPIAANGRTICEYTTADGIRPAVVAASNPFALPTLGASRAVLLVASVRTFIRTGTSAAVTASVGAQSIPVPADVPFHLLVPAGHTHIAVIRDGAADGAITVMRAID